MGRLVMSFRGLCLHLDAASAPLPDGVKHSVVAVNADKGDKGAPPSRWGPLAAHKTYLELCPEVAEAIRAQGLPELDPLRGGSLRVINPAGTAPLQKQSLEDLPRLTDYADMILRPDILDVANFHVDISHGTLDVYQFDLGVIMTGGLYTTWTVETDGDPLLEVTLRGQPSVTVRIPSTPEKATLSNDVPGSIVLRNSGVGDGDKSSDFLLYYLASTTGIPQVLKRLPPGMTDPRFRHTTELADMTTACSNAGYP